MLSISCHRNPHPGLASKPDAGHPRQGGRITGAYCTSVGNSPCHCERATAAKACQVHFWRRVLPPDVVILQCHVPEVER